MPVADSSVDVIISNCVINLSPDKDAVFGEAYRVLKPGGRLCVSDIVLLEELPDEVKENLDQWSRCIAGALNEKTYLEKVRNAGLVEVSLEGKAVPSGVKSEASPSQNPEGRQVDLRGKVASVTVKAFKPG